jgi:Ni,Fe-hydrogenase III large subunit/Ni,Fe-hydrogenase III component G
MKKLLEVLSTEFDAPINIISTAFPAKVSACSVPKDRFAEAARLMKRAGAMLAAEWATDETNFGRGFGVHACYRRGGEYLIVSAMLAADMPVFPSLTRRFVPAYRFERQMQSLMGVMPEGHPDLRPWIKFEDWPPDAFPLRKSFDPTTLMPRVPGAYIFATAEGEGVYEIPVGPVHAGIIEPGHFRFQAMGEDIINLEERLGYVHKGIEKRFESFDWIDAVRLAARVSGDTTVAHSLAYCMALESMTACTVPEYARWIRAIMLERERIANHLADIGAICNDVAFSFMLYQTMRLKEVMLRTNQLIFGHRFMMDIVVPGGVVMGLDAQHKTIVLEELSMIEDEFERLVKIFDENSSLDDRIRKTGILSFQQACDLGVNGLVARASGLSMDCRRDFPFHPYDQFAVNVPIFDGGDVHARAWVRIEEVRESIRLIRAMIASLPKGQRSVVCKSPAADTTGFAAVEGWRGEIIYWLQSGPQGEINRVMVRDPSSLCWIGLERCVLGNIVPDFPLCNKSFNQSYSGNDL